MKFLSKKSIPPESILYTGKEDFETTIRHLQYNQINFHVYNEKVDFKDDAVDWIIVEGLKDVAKITSLCQELNVDNLTIEDILNVNQRNKIEAFDKYIFAVQKYTYQEDLKLKTDYVSMLLFNDKLVTFSEKHNLFITNIFERIKNPISLVRKHRHNYLFYVIYDIITDEMFNVFNYISEEVSKLEESLLALQRNDELLLYNLRKELVRIRSYSDQIKENLFSSDNLLNRIKEENTSKYFKDLEDHIVNLNEKSKYELELLRGIFDMYMNNNSHKMNQIMKTLTIFSAIFIPLSFLSGVFGMNFTNFPILRYEYGLVIFTIFSIMIPLSMLLYFKKSKWF